VLPIQSNKFPLALSLVLRAIAGETQAQRCQASHKGTLLCRQWVASSEAQGQDLIYKPSTPLTAVTQPMSLFAHL
jgi:hypothetical protein